MAKYHRKTGDETNSEKSKVDSCKNFISLCRNWWIWSPESWRFEDLGLYMRRDHVGGDFTRIPEDALLLRKCSLL